MRSETFIANGQETSAQAAIIFEVKGALAQVTAGSAPRGVFFSGTPINEPRYPQGPFMGNTPQDVAQYAARFQRGEMGSLSKSF
jgi:redox-sensitive bicupin YhaK (pirin superfamily)